MTKIITNIFQNSDNDEYNTYKQNNPKVELYQYTNKEGLKEIEELYAKAKNNTFFLLKYPKEEIKTAKKLATIYFDDYGVQKEKWNSDDSHKNCLALPNIFTFQFVEISNDISEVEEQLSKGNLDVILKDTLLKFNANIDAYTYIYLDGIIGHILPYRFIEIQPTVFEIKGDYTFRQIFTLLNSLGFQYNNDSDYNEEDCIFEDLSQHLKVKKILINK